MSDYEEAAKTGYSDLIKAQKETLAAVTRLESRLDIVSGELGRTIATLNRVGAYVENAKSAAIRRERLLGEIDARLKGIETTLRAG